MMDIELWHCRRMLFFEASVKNRLRLDFEFVDRPIMYYLKKRRNYNYFKKINTKMSFLLRKCIFLQQIEIWRILH
jgi:hypothetical protein